MKMPNIAPFNDWKLLTIIAIGLYIMVVVSYFSVVQRPIDQGLEAMGWPEVDGRVTGSRIEVGGSHKGTGPLLRVNYEYEGGSGQFTKSSAFNSFSMTLSNTLSTVDDQVTEYTAGKMIKVRAGPNGRSYTFEGDEFERALLLPISLLLCAILFTVFAYRMKPTS